MDEGAEMPTSRRDAKDRRRQELLRAAAQIMAEKGFAKTRLADVGEAVGVSGPALYRHFSGKDDLLATVLVDISIRLVDGARAVLAEFEEEGPERQLRELIAGHSQFAATEPELITIQGREMENLTGEPRDKVRSLQRTYLRMWTDVLLGCKPELERTEARLRVQLVAGLINASRHVVHWAGEDLTRAQSEPMALASLLADRQVGVEGAERR